MTAAFVCAVSIFLNAGAAFAADDVAVDVQNASEPTLCAEKDNVYLKLTSPEARRRGRLRAPPAFHHEVTDSTENTKSNPRAVILVPFVSS